MKLVWMSHVLAKDTPLYGGSAGKMNITGDRSQKSGDSCNTSILHLPSHAGTHVDVPYHFISDGKCIDDYQPEAWVFSSPLIIDVSIDPAEIMTPDTIRLLPDHQKMADIVLFRTGFEKYRSQQSYWENGPGLSPSLADHLLGVYPNLRAVGIDFISISSIHDRDIVREAHKAFLERGLLLLEDMSMCEIGVKENLTQVVALPLRFVNGDGAPCTIIGWIDDKSSCTL